MKTLILFAVALLAGLRLTAQPVAFVDGTNSVEITGFLSVDGNPLLNQTAVLTENQAASFSGGIPLGLEPGSPFLTYSFSILDAGSGSPFQAQFTIHNDNAFTVPVSAASLVFGVANLFPLDPGLVLDGEFNFLTGDTTLTQNFSSSYDVGTGTFRFMNSAAFALPIGASSFTGNFTASAIPEPSSYAALAGLAAVALALQRRRARPAA